MHHLLVLLLAAGAGQAAQQQETATAPPPNASERMICEHEEVLGSRLQGRRVCKTAREWVDERRSAREEIERAQTQRGTGSGH